jgi:hypothetical protein
VLGDIDSARPAKIERSGVEIIFKGHFQGKTREQVVLRK